LFGRLPYCFYVSHETRNEQEIERTFTDDLIGNVDVIALDIVGRGYFSHHPHVS
jgi:hypothetical protein